MVLDNLLGLASEVGANAMTWAPSVIPTKTEGIALP